MGSHNRRAITPDQRKKWIKIFREYEPKTHSTMYALHSLAQHWVENEALIERAAIEEVKKNGPKWTPKDDDEIGKFLSERDVARIMHDDIMIPMHRYSCIVMLSTTVEREFKRLVENLEKISGPKNKKVEDMKEKSYLARVANFVEVFYGLRFADCPQYTALIDLQKIRNCIIHCHGEARLLDNRKENHLVKLQANHPGFFAHSPNGIWIKSECIRQFFIKIWGFFTWVFDKLKWEINSCFQGNKLERTFKELETGRKRVGS